MILALALAWFPQEDPSARFQVRPEAVEVGEPFELVLELEHGEALDAWELTGQPLALDASWVLLDEEGPSSEPLLDGRRLTTRSWRLVSLEPGPRSLAAFLPVLPDVPRVDAGATTVDVRSVLREDETRPRPLRGFPEGFGQGGAAPRSEDSRPFALLAGALVAAALPIVLWLRRQRRKPRVVPTASPLEELEALRQAGAETAQVVSERHFHLTRLVRSATDAAAGEERAGLTDTEWLAAVRGTSLFSEELEDLLQRAESVKYGGTTPTSWALDEAYGAARGALEGLAQHREAAS